MSADNTVVVLRTKRKFLQQGHVFVNGNPHYVWRVAHVQAFDNYDWFEENQSYNLGAYLKDVFGSCVVFESEEKALMSAHALVEAIGFVEYGVQLKNTEFVLYGDM